MQQPRARKRRPVDIGTGVLAQDQADTEARANLGLHLLGYALGWSVPLGYLLYEIFLKSFLSR